MSSSDETRRPAASTPDSPGGPRRSRRLLVRGTAVGVVVVLLGVAALLLHQRSTALTLQAAQVAEWTEEVDAWQLDALAVVPEPTVRLGPLVSGAATETAEGIAAVTAECDRVASAATAAADPPDAPEAPAGLDRAAAGYDAVENRLATSSESLTGYATAAAGAADALADLCAVYPALAQINLDQAGAIEGLRAQLGACDLADVGCLPRDRAAWPAIADSVDAAYTEPERRRAELFGGSCPSDALTDVCATLAANASAVVPLYEQVAQAIRDASGGGITTARDALAAQLDTNAGALAATAAPFLTGDVTDPEVAVAQAYRQIALDADAAWLSADGTLMVALD
ncbi:hypothetical protein C8046_06775 [Serinibacter arcticus]|uniref:Uncharacterized protein n=1 Tax=Serinibacter arcticus TaxID=1655435 RepID=A0A2U1ZTT6_9MICO|nr:hypothetical protein [Serinibacter arcticus]PWD50397.1 hypothetical protein C8046_06775 [Serinibacter arcticus]